MIEVLTPTCVCSFSRSSLQSSVEVVDDMFETPTMRLSTFSLPFSGRGCPVGEARAHEDMYVEVVKVEKFNVTLCASVSLLVPKVGRICKPVLVCYNLFTAKVFIIVVDIGIIYITCG